MSKVAESSLAALQRSTRARGLALVIDGFYAFANACLGTGDNATLGAALHGFARRETRPEIRIAALTVCLPAQSKLAEAYRELFAATERQLADLHKDPADVLRGLEPKP